MIGSHPELKKTMSTTQDQSEALYSASHILTLEEGITICS